MNLKYNKILAKVTASATVLAMLSPITAFAAAADSVTDTPSSNVASASASHTLAIDLNIADDLVGAEDIVVTYPDFGLITDATPTVTCTGGGDPTATLVDGGADNVLTITGGATACTAGGTITVTSYT